MKKSKTMNAKNIVSVSLLIVLGLFPVGRLSAASSYTLTQIPTPYGGLSNVMDMNNLGHVAYWGGGSYANKAYLWDGTTAVRLPGDGYYSYSIAYSVNDSDLSVGSIDSAYSYCLATKWQYNELTVLDLGDLQSYNSAAQAVNNSGLIAGISAITGGKHLFTMSPSGTVTDHGLLPSYYHSVLDMNEAGQIVLMDSGPLTNGFVWENGQYTALSDLEGGVYSAPQAINNDGLVVGMSWPGQQNAKAVVWQNGQIVQVLPVPEGTTGSCAFDVNNLGQIAGYYQSSQGGRRACLWDSDGTFHDLADLVIGGSPSWLNIAKAINDQGQIAVWGYTNQAWVLTPIPEPLEIAIDIKPGSDPNSVNLGANGVVPVAIFGAEEFDVNDVDRFSLLLEGAGPREKGKDDIHVAFEYINDDLFLDLIVQFSITGLELEDGATEAALMGSLLDGTEFMGTDAIRLVGGPTFRGDVHGIPEPASASLLLLGGLALLRRRRKVARLFVKARRFSSPGVHGLSGDD